MMIPNEYLPTLNAILNGSAALLLIFGYGFIRRQRVQAHVVCMLGALLVSSFFLASYVYYHVVVRHGESTHFTRQGPVRTFYFTLLISHILLAVVIVPLALITAYLGLSGKLDPHRRLARWTLPAWLYVSITGVVVYWMLYHLYPNQ